tara:strand:+ start:3014 stop:3571 length:558 start_codon:yes stop_codon:yes gene_type:complete
MNDIVSSDQTCDSVSAEPLPYPQASPKEGQSLQSAALQSTPMNLDDIEAEMLAHPQVDCPVVHHFAPGICLREGFYPAGIYILGHSHKKTTINILIKGTMAIIVDGKPKIIKGPVTFSSPPGRKFAYIIEDCIFQNVLPTNSTDLEEIEAEFVEKTEPWKDKQFENASILSITAAVKQHFNGVTQ